MCICINMSYGYSFFIKFHLQPKKYRYPLFIDPILEITNNPATKHPMGCEFESQPLRFIKKKKKVLTNFFPLKIQLSCSLFAPLPQTPSDLITIKINFIDTVVVSNGRSYLNAADPKMSILYPYQAFNFRYTTRAYIPD